MLALLSSPWTPTHHSFKKSSTMASNLLFLEHKAYLLRKYSLEMTTKAGSGHPTSCLSAADLVAALFFHAMRYDPEQFDALTNDRFILSKGHASPLLYAAWCEVGVISYQELMNYRTFDSPLEGHPTPRFAYTEVATGSLGMGLSIAVGICLDAQREQRDSRTFVLMGDAEVAEGSVWEAAELAAYYQLHSCIALLDGNRWGQSTQSLHAHDLQKYARKFAAFGWNVLTINGHDMQEIVDALDQARAYTKGPTIIIAKTYKGYGVQLFEDKPGFHGVPCSQADLPRALQELQQFFPEAAASGADNVRTTSINQQTMLASKPALATQIKLNPLYQQNEMVATRKAFGQALVVIGKQNETLVVLDADVQNSTYTQFFHEAFPDRFVECFIAEQTMVGMAVGFARCNKIPFVATFASFLTRAHDQIRMAAIGRIPLRLVGSHVGVSIGQDGPSQMGLEDIAMMAALPESIILYPADATSAQHLTALMVTYTAGVSYMRTTRMATPLLYDAQEQFFVGGCKVVRRYQNAQACIISAGITLHEALKAHDQLQEQGISVCVIDLYSVKPIDRVTIKEIVMLSNKKVVTVEDHYLQGGLGQIVAYELGNDDVHITCLAVQHLPRSAQPEQLLAWAGIDATAIVKAVHALLDANISVS